MKIYISHSSNFDFQNELYAPLIRVFSAEHAVYLPHSPENAGKNTKDIILDTDLVLAEVSCPSTGQGIELGWAEAAGIPIICFHKTESKPSGALNHITQKFIAYDTENDMTTQLAIGVNDALNHNNS
jgi:nucleoside 2-deoxyribosyltransferase